MMSDVSSISPNAIGDVFRACGSVCDPRALFFWRDLQGARRDLCLPRNAGPLPVFAEGFHLKREARVQVCNYLHLGFAGVFIGERFEVLLGGEDLTAQHNDGGGGLGFFQDPVQDRVLWVVFLWQRLARTGQVVERAFSGGVSDDLINE